MILLHLVLLLILLRFTRAGHEVLHASSPSILNDHDLLLPHELAIVQFDSRPLDDYWNTSARWNHAFAHRWNHKYIFLTMTDKDLCAHPGGVELSAVWCKVKAMVRAKRKFSSEIKAFLYMDSDMAVTIEGNYSLTDVINFMRQDLPWDVKQMPLAFNQDGPGWACKHAIQDVGYRYCFNSGTVLWWNTPLAHRILYEWWMLAAQPYEKSRFPEEWRRRWPWEQAQMYATYAKFHRYIMRLSFPKEPFLPWTSLKNPRAQYPTDHVEPWCFSHWPGANCFLTHFCGSLNQKRRLRDEYVLNGDVRLVLPMDSLD